jgi:predicted XRE-type DNA-binding protein
MGYRFDHMTRFFARGAVPLLAASLARLPERIVQRRRLTQEAAAAKLLGIRQPKAFEPLRGHLDGFSTDRLLGFITQLGYTV